MSIVRFSNRFAIRQDLIEGLRIVKSNSYSLEIVYAGGKTYTLITTTDLCLCKLFYFRYLYLARVGSDQPVIEFDNWDIEYFKRLQGDCYNELCNSESKSFILDNYKQKIRNYIYDKFSTKTTI